MEPLWDLLKIIIPAAIVLYAMYLAIQTMLQKSNERNLINLKGKNKEIILPLRLQAYERMCLYLERISPEQLIRRGQQKDQNVAELQFLLLNEIREEFNHNLAQQVYISNDAWSSVKTAKEELIMSINQAAKELNPEDKALSLVKRIYEQALSKTNDSIAYSLALLKEEIQREF